MTIRTGHLSLWDGVQCRPPGWGSVWGRCVNPLHWSCPFPPDWAVYQLWQCHQAAGHSLWHHPWPGPGISGEDQLLQLWHEEYVHHPQARGGGSGSSQQFPRMWSKCQLPLSSRRPWEWRDVAGLSLYTAPCLHARERGHFLKETPSERVQKWTEIEQMLSEHLLCQAFNATLWSAKIPALGIEIEYFKYLVLGLCQGKRVVAI